jgi:hypothetical protein
MYQKAVIAILGLAALAAFASADASFSGKLSGDAARILAAFEEETDEDGFTIEEANETAKLLRAAGASGTLTFPGGTLTV